MAARRKKTAPAGGEDGRVAAQGAEDAESTQATEFSPEQIAGALQAIRKVGAGSAMLLQRALNLNHIEAGRLFDYLMDRHLIAAVPGEVLEKGGPVLATVVEGPPAAGDDPSPAPSPSATSADLAVSPPRPASAAPRADLVMVPIASIDDSHNVRRGLDEAPLLRLGESIRDLGMLQPVVVRKVGATLRLIAGHRRVEAARRAGEEFVEAKVYAGPGVDDVWEARARLAENTQRQDLNHVELAGVLGQAADQGLGVPEIAAEVHLSDDSVRRHLALRRLTPPVLDLVASGRLPVHQAELIARVGDPKRQVDLAESATRLQWQPGKGAGGKWLAEGKFDYRKGKHLPGPDVQDAHDRDFVQPMDDLRSAVASAMQGLAACGWPMGEEYCGRRACRGCPDNTASYADQPMLFEGIEPRGSAKKGHCTTAACYLTKRAAWDQVLDERRKTQAKARAAAVKKARAAGLAVCDACGRVLAEGEKTESVGGEKCCPKCAKKATKKGVASGRGESYEARRKRAAAIRKRFPETPEQRLAVALHAHGAALAAAIEKAIVDWRMADSGNCSNVAEIVLWAQARLTWNLRMPDVVTQLEDALGPGIPAATLAAWWRSATEWARTRNEPCVREWPGEVENVPLPKGHVEALDGLTLIARHYGLAIPPRPTAEIAAAAGVRDGIARGGRADALAAIAACTDGKLLADLIADAADGKVQLPAYKRQALGERVTVLSGDPRGAEVAQGMTEAAKGAEGKRKKTRAVRKPAAPKGGGRGRDKVSPASAPSVTEWVEKPADNGLQNRIIQGRKADALAAINGCGDRGLLIACETIGLKGDWRRAAVARRIEDLRLDEGA